ncbi:helix-turn-helix domain-containing protein [Larsenimonas rhizosphaerae]|uniref:Helix-turn-helix domain-containing protein n=1 Tax=Larsenimonas rhizosphaerae TaxID=2944682 RepID=A0AA41ZHF9_9GAMM|nr:helix-turn-helix domain-containing protein [Larsenimonas rhizosphaerae]MCM2131322.1 helix-turn-helix domain-containing protein [Larsenimonas rhizosphaerae]MCX2525317.1 helix-turn-helix domain-containing protein [Larsenimonas rhizosphaerae]
MGSSVSMHLPPAFEWQHQITHDITEHQRVISGAPFHYQQLSSEPFHGTVTEIKLGRLKLFRDMLSTDVLKSGTLDRHTLCVSMPLSPHRAPLRCMGHVFEQAGMLVSHGHRLPELCAPGGVTVLVIGLAFDYLAALMDAQSCAPVVIEPFHRPLTARDGLWRLARQFGEANAQTLLQHNPLWRRELHDALIMALVDKLSCEEVHHLTPSYRQRVVDRARDLIAAQPDQPVSILTLCTDIGVSRRKLQYCFQTCLGMSPVSYIKLFRLNAVQRVLSTADHLTRVQDEAARWGFFHMGRFATEYRQFFGERPSETLVRAQRKAG